MPRKQDLVPEINSTGHTPRFLAMTPAPASPPGLPPTPVSRLALFASKVFTAIWFTHSTLCGTASVSKMLARQQPPTERFALWCHDVLSTSALPFSFLIHDANLVTNSKLPQLKSLTLL